ncbi:butyrate kinase [Enterococcus phoeniculicola]|jgi:butyrate kinase|uniref:Probable butyrate kinase n=1 Tax=Enterococcus phoeniculicola ATCC BAA-412 TaxID=1158610 RepID=R3W554_9ENTE|nr:butyrate kinase [Enterococcus phoeniculicola]EOL42732.1 butyrate kinase [Enterococcus phoeniculicola ATCC BAA-412]EOT78984.1 butyrate kinase [Enterococcus phoeniculicola ATCC BAA-412]OJG72473.1 butyrate kinase [Enterococcus phoeniculicola]
MEPILVINPGSTSTKLAIFSNHELIAEETIRHSLEEIAQFKGVIDQIDFRYKLILAFIDKHHLSEKLVAVVGRGGLLKPIPGGTYNINEDMLADLKEERYNTHASNLGAILANEIAEKWGIPAYIVDPVVVDELQPLAKISGLKGIDRRSVSHALNQKAVARKITGDLGKTYETSSVIVAHLGGGISVGAHKNGKMIDVINGLDGEGAYTPERSGGLPLVDFADLVIQKKLSLAEVKKLIAGNAGIKSYLGETDLRIVEKRMNEGDEEAKYYLDGMCYQVGKSVSELAAVLKGKVDAIILTGGVMYSEYTRNKITEYVEWIAPVKVFPGEMEMEALYEGVYRVLNGEETALDYQRA